LKTSLANLSLTIGHIYVAPEDLSTHQLPNQKLIFDDNKDQIMMLMETLFPNFSKKRFRDC